MNNSRLKCDSDSDIGIEQIVFYTHWWRNITDAIRDGRATGGTASVVRLWKKCAEENIDAHVFVVSPDSLRGASRTIELGGVKFYWIKPFAWSVRSKFTKGSSIENAANPFSLFCKIIDLLRVYRLSRRVVPKAQVHYSMRWGHGIVAYLLALRSGGISVIRSYGIGKLRSWDTRNTISQLPRTFSIKLPVDLHIVTNDGTQGDRFLKKLGIPSDRIRFWLNGIEHLDDQRLDRVQFRKEIGFLEADKLLVCVGRLACNKRQDLLIHSLSHVLKKHPKAHLILVGGGEEESNLRNLADRLNVSSNVSFVGDVPNEQVKNYLAVADLYFQVNENSNLSMTLMEALAAGCCCVIRNIGDLDGVVSNQNAIMVDDAKPEALARVTIELLSDPETVRQKQIAAKLTARDKLSSWDQRLELELNALSQALSSSRNPLSP